LLAWAFAHGRHPSDDEIEIWNAFMTKRGWRDAGTQRLNERLAEIGLAPGTAFGEGGKVFFRLCFHRDLHQLEEAATRLATWMRTA